MTTLPSLSVNYHHRDYLEPRDHYVLLELRTISYLFLSKVGIIPSKVSKHFHSFLSLHPFVVKACINNQPHRPPDLRTERSQLIKIYNKFLSKIVRSLYKCWVCRDLDCATDETKLRTKLWLGPWPVCMYQDLSTRYSPWLACWKSLCRFASQIERKFETHLR